MVITRILICAAILSVAGCHTLAVLGGGAVTKTVVVRPLEKETNQLVEAVPEFMGAATYFSLSESNRYYDAPLNWLTEVRRDGTMRITWTARRNAREGLYLTEAGFHPVEVPLTSATVIAKKDEFRLESQAVTLRMSGNTAYLPKPDRGSYRARKLTR